jgi:hypothetical protein
MRGTDRLHAAVIALGLAACQGGGPAPGGPPAGGVTVAAGNASATNVLPGPPPILRLPGTAAFATGGPTGAPLAVGVETTVEPRTGFRVELPVALADARLSLLDGDAMVASSSAREVGQATVLTLVPAAPLAPGARLRLRVDGVATRELHAGDGRRFEPLEWPVAVSGAPAPRPARRR